VPRIDLAPPGIIEALLGSFSAPRDRSNQSWEGGNAGTTRPDLAIVGIIVTNFFKHLDALMICFMHAVPFRVISVSPVQVEVD
jgi:hypothetical protein